MFWTSIMVFVALICTYIEISHQAYLEESGTDIILWLQGYKSPLLDLLFEILGGILAVFFLVASGVLYLCGHREIGMMGTYAGFFGAAISGTAKMLILHPRPFWKVQSIQVVSCPYDWGAPSGHASSGGAAMIILAYFWLQSKSNNFYKILLLILSLLITLIDRVYLGLHFHFQVILGYSYSAVVAFYYLSKTQREGFFSLSQNKKTLILELCKALGFVIFSVWVYSKQYIEIEESWKINYNDKCTRQLKFEDVMIKNISEAMYVWLISGMIFGFYMIKGCRKPIMSMKVVIISLAFYLGILVYVIASDKVFISRFPYYLRFAFLCLNRFAAGFVMGFYLPKAVLKVGEYGLDKQNN
ncbi:hypothetical protein SteCoe_10413 [Stentor coeruleus]|uniref:Phosphatidic acid phosphatase type 2/haloperoxidase domain-containing protein n=1 Tax=Stentor coeruleus TaxID=5963 RepID=A0A1R2CFH6_9CILI|nr:hypothetical protein SteCoe_10413 [Stentor coeruleus]